jgi:hypothetical protein
MLNQLYAMENQNTEKIYRLIKDSKDGDDLMQKT